MGEEAENVGFYDWAGAGDITARARVPSTGDLAVGGIMAQMAAHDIHYLKQFDEIGRRV